MKKIKQISTALLSLSLLGLSGGVYSAQRVDLLALYTDEAGFKDPAAGISAMVTYTNQALQNSGVDMQFRVVHLSKINFAGDETASSTALDRLQSNQNVAALREQYGADLVTLVTAPYYCGIAYLGFGNPDTGKLSSYVADSVPFSVVGAPCTSSMAHEVGHNMGLGHSYAQGSEGGVWPWARGHGVQNSFVTVMAYTSAYNARTLPYFSNPSINACKNQPCGRGISLADGADASTNLNRLASQIAAFRPEKDNGGGGTTQDTEPPTVPGNLSVEQVTESSISFGWRPSTDNNAVTGYEVLRDGNQVATVSVPSFSDQGLDAGTTYSYNVLAFDAANNRSALSDVLTAQTDTASTPVDTTPPTVPAGLTAVTITQNQVDLRWQPSEDSESSVVGYEVYRDDQKVGSSQQPSYSDAGLEAGVSYRYQVLALDSAQNRSALSDPLAVTTKPEDTGGPGTTDNLLSNGDFSSGVSGWRGFYSRIGIGSHDNGNPHLVSFYRGRWYSGVTRSVYGLVNAGETYRISASLRHDSGSAQTGRIYLHYNDNTGGHWILLKKEVVNGWSWQDLSAEFTIQPNGDLRDAFLLIAGPASHVNLGVDDVVLQHVTK
ncbi:MAG: fibronectin type III domain-containing protein [Candidatus Thiodiazotropha sp. (ex Dulcina madagascariensis)]|nr:fibronectin type III domain-containing protein [Candidatus Thiodiazotropha sp. (ex Dulcina madagascariensis)]